MMWSILYALLWMILLFLGIHSKRIFKRNQELIGLTTYGFLFKSLVSIGFYYGYTVFVPKGNFFLDAGGYLKDSISLNHVFYESPIDYLKLLTGFGETKSLIMEHLKDTTLWDKGTSIYNDSKNVIRFNSLLVFISHGNAFVHIVFMNLISTLGLRWIVLTFKRRMLAYRLFYALLLFGMPGLMFVSGGILKEPILIFGAGLLLYSVFSDWILAGKISTALFGLLLMICIKPYVLGCLSMALLYLIFANSCFKKRPLIASVIFVFIVSLPVIFSSDLRQQIADNLTKKQVDTERVAMGGLYLEGDKQQKEYYFVALKDLDKVALSYDSAVVVTRLKGGRKTMHTNDVFEPLILQPDGVIRKIEVFMPEMSSSYVATKPIENSFKNVIYKIPEAFVNASFRPFIGDAGKIAKYPAFLEMILIFGCCIFAVFSCRKLTVGDKRIVISLILFAVMLLVLVGMTTPVVGAIVRYRLPAYIAVLAFSFIIISIPEKWKEKIL